MFSDNTEYSLLISIKEIDSDLINMDDFYNSINATKMMMIDGCLVSVDDLGNEDVIWCLGSQGGSGSGGFGTGVNGSSSSSSSSSSNYTGSWFYMQNSNGSCNRTITLLVLKIQAQLIQLAQPVIQ
ncbi:hypothetical protein [Lacinutrix sp. MEBiC02404]